MKCALTASLILLPLAAYAQPNPATQVVSPEVHPDSRVTFRLFAPKAQEVDVRGEFLDGGKPLPLQKDDQGVWSVTAGPVRPDFYPYSFSVDGLNVSDPRNPVMKLGSRGAGVSMVDIPGPEVEFHANRKVPHGTIHVHHYWSEPVGGMRRVHVYTPPGYEKDSRTRYPALYLLHGAGDTDAEWCTIGRANWILDNLLAAGKAKPMLVVMPDGHPAGISSIDPNRRRRALELFEEDLLKEVQPLVERTYRADTRPAARALAGLSMGGGQTLFVGLRNLVRFSHLGVFSSGTLRIPRDQFEEEFQEALANSDRTNKALRLFWIGCGKTDFLYESNTLLLNILKDRDIRHTYHESEGGHTWVNWRHYLHGLLPLLFR